MIHYYGNPLNETCMDLGEQAKKFLASRYQTKFLDTTKPCFVSFVDHRTKTKRFVKFEWLAGQWVFTDIIDWND